MNRDILVKGYEADMLAAPETYYAKPFRIMGNLFFAGTKEVGVHILQTEEGLILIDTGWPWTRCLILQSLYELGFQPGDIRILLHTHAHVDHFGCTNFLKMLSGAKTYISAADAVALRERPELLWGDPRTAFTPDTELNDGDIVRLGSTEILCKAAPGHTIGTMAFFFYVTDTDGTRYRCAMHGGVGINTLSAEYLAKNNLPDMRAMYRDTAKRLMQEHVDITLGNHTPQNHTEEKYAQMCRNPDGPNPFIDPTEWQRLLSSRLKLLDELEQEEKHAE